MQSGLWTKSRAAYTRQFGVKPSPQLSRLAAVRPQRLPIIKKIGPLKVPDAKIPGITDATYESVAPAIRGPGQMSFNPKINRLRTAQQASILAYGTKPEKIALTKMITENLPQQSLFSIEEPKSVAQRLGLGKRDPEVLGRMKTILDSKKNFYANKGNVGFGSRNINLLTDLERTNWNQAQSEQLNALIASRPKLSNAFNARQLFDKVQSGEQHLFDYFDAKLRKFDKSWQTNPTINKIGDKFTQIGQTLRTNLRNAGDRAKLAAQKVGSRLQAARQVARDAYAENWQPRIRQVTDPILNYTRADWNRDIGNLGTAFRNDMINLGETLYAPARTLLNPIRTRLQLLKNWAQPKLYSAARSGLNLVKKGISSVRNYATALKTKFNEWRNRGRNYRSLLDADNDDWHYTTPLELEPMVEMVDMPRPSNLGNWAMEGYEGVPTFGDY